MNLLNIIATLSYCDKLILLPRNLQPFHNSKLINMETFCSSSSKANLKLIMACIMVLISRLFIIFNLKETSLEDRPFMTIKEIEDYGENSVSPVNYLILESLGEVSKCSSLSKQMYRYAHFSSQ